MTNEERYILSRWCYSVGQPIITDAEYNNLHRYMQSQDLLPDYTNRAWSSDPCPYELLKAHGMEDKAYNITLSDKTESIESFTSEAEVERFYGHLDESAYINFKHDGFNGQFIYHNYEYVNGQTRGRSSDALTLDNLRDLMPKKIDILGKVRVIGEMTLTAENFKILKQMYPEKELTSQRSSVRTALANKEAAHLVTFTAFDILMEDAKQLNMSYILFKLKSWGFEIPEYRTVMNYKELLVAIKELSEYRALYPHPTDGLVVRTDVGGQMRAIRVMSWEEPIYKSYITGYEEGYGSRFISLKLLIYPIRLEGGTQQRIPITNIGRIVENNLTVGSPIAFKITSASIADIDLEVTKMLQKMYTNRERDYQFLVEHGEYVKSTNRVK